MRSMSCCDLRLKTPRWFLMRSTMFWKSSWRSANICSTWWRRERRGEGEGRGCRVVGGKREGCRQESVEEEGLGSEEL